MQTDLLSQVKKKMNEVLIHHECVYKSWVRLWFSCNSLLHGNEFGPSDWAGFCSSSFATSTKWMCHIFFSLHWPPFSHCVCSVLPGSCSSLPGQKGLWWKEQKGSTSLTDIAEGPWAGAAMEAASPSPPALHSSPPPSQSLSGAYWTHHV